MCDYRDDYRNCKCKCKLTIEMLNLQSITGTFVNRNPKWPTDCGTCHHGVGYHLCEEINLFSLFHSHIISNQNLFVL